MNDILKLKSLKFNLLMFQEPAQRNPNSIHRMKYTCREHAIELSTGNPLCISNIVFFSFLMNDIRLVSFIVCKACKRDVLSIGLSSVWKLLRSMAPSFNRLDKENSLYFKGNESKLLFIGLLLLQSQFSWQVPHLFAPLYICVIRALHG